MNKQTIGAAALLAALILGGCTGQSASSTGSDAASTQSNAAAPGSAAQGGQPAGNPGARRHFAQALMSLNLSDAQKTQIREIMTAARAQAKTQDPDTRRATMRAAFTKVEAILTPEQRTQFQAKLAALRVQQPPSAAPTQ